MLLAKLERLEDYVRYLRAHPAEVKALYQELLISVTNFSRPGSICCVEAASLSDYNAG